MTACSKWRDEMLDVALGRVASQELRSHLEMCAACSTEFSKLQAAGTRMDAALAGLRAPEGPSENFRAALQHRMQTQGARKSRRVVWQLAAGAVLTVAVAGAIARQAGLRRDADLISSAAAISEWRSPTEGLLRSSADSFLKSAPRLGETYFPIETPAAKARGTQIRRKS